MSDNMQSGVPEVSPPSLVADIDKQSRALNMRSVRPPSLVLDNPWVKALQET